MVRRFGRVAGIIAATLFSLLMILTVLDVAGRSIFNRPLPGASELTEIALASIVFLMLPVVAFRRKHITVDIISSISPRPLLVGLDVISALCGFIVFAMIGWQLWISGERAAEYGDATPTLHSALSPFLFAMGVLSLVTAIAFLLTVREAGKPAEPHGDSADSIPLH